MTTRGAEQGARDLAGVASLFRRQFTQQRRQADGRRSHVPQAFLDPLQHPRAARLVVQAEVVAGHKRVIGHVPVRADGLGQFAGADRTAGVLVEPGERGLDVVGRGTERLLHDLELGEPDRAVAVGVAQLDNGLGRRLEDSREMWPSMNAERIPSVYSAGESRPSPCFNRRVTANADAPKVVTAHREIAASAEKIFELIADPARQPSWDGNENLAEAPAGQRVHGTGDVFTMVLTKNRMIRENRIVEFEEGRRIAWLPSEPDKEPPGHLWRWELEPLDDARTKVTHTYDWSRLTDENRLPKARATTADKLQASLDRLAALAES